ncbi:MAG: PDZ domain-containing protein [candidate division WOR-3 bacterium]|uniref:PDZ domain-containing protein n=1 Tax=candidate division WOR-3 bacterium TaxID=2052148 RepID=A0A7C2APK9_UNCW3|nr:PDZ domain-containing protein [candidate division WOR-3 bacterium]
MRIRAAVWCRYAAAGLGLISLAFSACKTAPPGKPLGATYAELGKAEIWKIPARSEAQTVGLKVGDVIIGYNDEPVRDVNEYFHLEREAVTAGSGEKVRLTVLRDDQELSFEVRRIPLGFLPKSRMYGASLAKALDDVIQHYGQPGMYDWLAALTGESFAVMLEENNPYSWGTDGLAENYISTVEQFTGLSLRLRYSRESEEVDSAAPDPGLQVIRKLLAQNRDLVVLGKWGDQPALLWGIPVRINPADSTVLGWTLDYGTEQTLTGEVVSVYEVGFRGPVTPEPADMLSSVLEQALELGLRSSDRGWHSGLEAYDIVLKQLEQFPVVPEGIDAGNECFYRLVWRLMAKKESANRFLNEMKQVLPEQADLIEEVLGRNRAIIGKLEGVMAANLRLDSPANQQKAARVIAEIQEIENDLLGLYEELIGDL